MASSELIDGSPNCPNPGGLLLVANSARSPDRTAVEMDASQTVKNVLLEVGEASTKFTGCKVGTRHSLVEVDKGKGIASSNEPKVQAFFTEATSLSITGKGLPAYSKLMEICSNISPNLSCSYDDFKCSVTVSGFWDDVHKARLKIHMLMLETSPRKMEYWEDVKENSSPDSEVSLPTYPKPNPIFPTSCYESVSVAPHVMRMMKRRCQDFGPGITYKEGSSTVHFSFNSDRELDAAIEKFQKESDSLEEGLRTECMRVPRGIHKDEQFALIVSQLEEMYEDTIITWLDGEVEIEVVSTRVEEVTHDLEKMMQQAIADDHHQGNESRGSSTREKSNTGKYLKKLGSWLTSSPKIAYRDHVELNFPGRRRFVLRHGNLLHERVDAIVNPANQFLSHGAGLAKQIDKASKGSITRLSNEHVSARGGRVPTGSVVTTSAGNGDLSCSYVIHAVGPNAHEIGSERECVSLLERTINAIIKEGCRLMCQSIAIPAISSGLFGMKKETVAETIVHALVNYQQSQHTHSYLTDIRVVVWDRDTYDPFYYITCGIESSLKLH